MTFVFFKLALDDSLKNSWIKVNLFSSFADGSIRFECRYARTVTATSSMSLGSAADETISGNGELTYKMEIAAGVVGGNSVVTISPNNNIPGIGAR